MMTAAMFLLACGTAQGAAIQGKVEDKSGAGLSGITICLEELDNDMSGCRRTRDTDKNGFYQFNGIREGFTYRVSIASSDYQRTTEWNTYKHYTWSPASREVSLIDKQDKVTEISFTGSFGFSNYKREFILDSSHFPELVNFNTAGDIVFLKAWMVSLTSGEEEVVFLGRVGNGNALTIRLSVPHATAEIHYQIYSASDSTGFSGSIPVDRL